MARRKIIPIGTRVIYTQKRTGHEVIGTLIDARYYPGNKELGGRIIYEVLDDADGRTIWEGNSREVKPFN